MFFAVRNPLGLWPIKKPTSTKLQEKSMWQPILVVDAPDLYSTVTRTTSPIAPCTIEQTTSYGYLLLVSGSTQQTYIDKYTPRFHTYTCIHLSGRPNYCLVISARCTWCRWMYTTGCCTGRLYVLYIKQFPDTLW